MLKTDELGNPGRNSRVPTWGLFSLRFTYLNFYHYFKRFRPEVNFKILFELFISHSHHKTGHSSVLTTIRKELFSPRPPQIYKSRAE